MSGSTISPEEQILQIMKRVLTDIAKETFTRPGFSHPLSDDTIHNMREALRLISERERELASQRGDHWEARPQFVDEPGQPQVVTFRKPDA